MDSKATEPQPEGDAGQKRSAERESVPSDGTLVLQALAGKKVAFDQLVRRYQRQAVAVSYRLLGNIHDAMEVTQDAFVKAYGSLSTLQRHDAFGGWLLRIVSNLSLNFRRGRESRQQLPLDDLLGPAEPTQAAGSSDWMARSGDPLHNLESQELGLHLEQALKQLPEKQRQAIVLFTVHQMPQKEVAEQLGCSVEAVKWHVFQGRKKLKDLLKDIL